MQSSKVLVLLIGCVLGVAVLATAANNKFGVADVLKINFMNSVRIGDVVLPQGDYESGTSCKAKTTSWFSIRSAARRPKLG